MTELASVAGAHRVTTAVQRLRFRVVGSQVMLRTWLEGAPEPSTWAWSLNDLTLTFTLARKADLTSATGARTRRQGHAVR